MPTTAAGGEGVAGGRPPVPGAAAIPSGAAPRPLVVLIWASWSDPSRPSVTTARELGRKHRESVQLAALDVADESVELPSTGPGPVMLPGGLRCGDRVDADRLLDALRIEVLPTWLRLEPVGGSEGAAWQETLRVEGAQPKHAVERRLVMGEA